MRIQHNIAAMNSYRNYVGNSNSLAKNLEKLSSGYKINRAGDDAAGLAISEKMRAQIAGLDQAQANVKDGISLVKTAEGALQEVQDMMNRMVTLATQSANGTYQNEVDRENLQAEVDALKAEIDRIAESSNFNGQKLLNGELSATETIVEVAGTEVQDMGIEVSAGTLTSNTATGPSYEATIAEFDDAKFDAFKITYTNNEGVEKTITLSESAVAGVSKTASKGAEDLAGAINGSNLTISDTSSNAKADLEEFMELFDVSGDGATLTISAKEADSTAKVTSIAQGSNAALATAISGATAVSGTSKAAEAANTTWQLANATDTITIAGKEYSADGAADAAAAAKDILKQLQADGYSVELDADDATGATIKFTDMTQLQETQKGTQIVNAEDDKWDVNASASSKGKVEFTLATATTADDEHTLTINYVNEAGKNVSKEIKYKDGTATTAGNAAAALKTAIEGDAELNELFKVTTTAGSDAFGIESKASGTDAAYITGVEFGAANLLATTSALKITEPTDTGKTLEMALKSDGTTPETIKNGDQITIDGKTYQFMKDTGASVEDGVIKVALGADTAENFENLQKALEKNGVSSELYKGTGATVIGLRFTDTATETTTTKAGGLTLQIGDTAEKHNQLNVSIEDMHTKALGIADINIGNIKGAQEAIETIKTAINKVSSTRGNLGAIQNRLEHTQNNLSVMTENIQDAESTIRDTDIADEMTTYTKNNILLQSAQAMLAQANQMPQGVLQLLQ